MPYNPKGFNDIGGDASMAPSELQPPLNFADGGAVSWAGDSTVYNTQSQIGNMLATPGGFSGMSRQFTSPSPMAMAEGGDVKTRLAAEFAKRGLDLNKFIERRAYAYGGDVRDGDNPGGLSGDTGAYSGFSGGDDSRDAAFERDYNLSSPERFNNDTGGNDRGFFDTLSDVVQQVVGVTPAEAGQKIIGTGGYLPEVISGEKQFPNQIELNKLRAEEDAAREQQESFNKAKAQADLVEQSLLFPITGFEKPFGQTTTFNKDQSGILPAGVWTGPELPDINQAAEAARVAAAQPVDTFYTDLQRVKDKLEAIRGMNTSASMIGADKDAAFDRDYNLSSPEKFNNVATEAAKPSPLEAYSQATRPSGVFSPFESAVEAAISSAAPTELARAAGTFTSPFEKVLKSVAEAKMTAQVSKQAEPKQSLFEEYNAEPPVTANVPVPLPRPKDLGIETEPVTTTARAPATAVTPTTVAPTQKGVLDQIMSGMDAANAKRITELEQANKFAGGNKAQVASALGVDPSELKSRIVIQDGQQKVDYYTKGLDQVLGEMIAGPSKAIGDLFAPNVNNLPRGSYVRDPLFIDMFSQNVPSKGYGPYGDLTAEEYRQQYGGGNDRGSAMQAQIATPVQTAAVTPPVTPAPTTPLTTFSRKYIPITNYAQYGYGPEALFYNYAAAEGGPVGPLSQKRK